ncbi:hypothetical protein [Stigmatella aurantiaca]|uniref:Uncharacterized protein n=1 Tax=Stigmatella aurantiaca (strain DW4/3-1) TaxID=378806 RepID=Q093L6_STIAD|nr:hypothetical protein [Stigmatella aurantiaca]ADO72715.1 uncharacterized protein STAUR_4937 [Stigmatella aurantiaca DW4/3-1]EAU66938.1 hypothetical protein STIAU_0082 [Stigmatella aurantiaca DW4/3-1]
MALTRFACILSAGVTLALAGNAQAGSRYEPLSLAGFVGTSCANPAQDANLQADWLISSDTVPYDWVPVLLVNADGAIWRMGGNLGGAVCDGPGRWPMAVFKHDAPGGLQWNVYVEPWGAATPVGFTLYFLDSTGTTHAHVVE